MQCKIITPAGQFKAQIADTPLGRKIIAALPLDGAAQTWGDEIYFPIPIDHQSQNTQQVVGIGDLAFWAPGKALCIFFGSTPLSRDDKPRAAGPVEVFGRIIADPPDLRTIRDGELIRIEAL